MNNIKIMMNMMIMKNKSIMKNMLIMMKNMIMMMNIKIMMIMTRNYEYDDNDREYDDEEVYDYNDKEYDDNNDDKKNDSDNDYYNDDANSIAAGGPDKQLVISFYDGKTASIEKDRAVWIPTDLHERILFELNLPKSVRQEQAKRDLYPVENLQGYPTSGPKAFPPEFPRYVPPGWVDGSASRIVGDPGSLWYSSNQQRPWLYNTKTNTPRTISTKTEDVERVIPGTDLTQSQLNAKVMSQIRANDPTTTRSKQITPQLRDNTNGSLRRNHDSSFSNETNLKKSVSFADLTSSKFDSEGKDSGHESQTELYFTDDDDDHEYNGSGSLTKRGDQDFHGSGSLTKRDDHDFHRYGSLTKRDAWSSTDLSLLYPRRSRRSKSAGGQRKWKYWRNDPAPSLMDPMHYGAYRAGPYKDCTDMPGMLRDVKKYEYGGMNFGCYIDLDKGEGRR